MFVLCPHCQFLVATDPVSGQPPPLCPRCAEPMYVRNASDSLPPVEEADVLIDPAPDGSRPQPTLPADRRTDNTATASAAGPSAAAPSQALDDAAAAAELARARRETMLAVAMLAEVKLAEAKLAPAPVEIEASQDASAAEHDDPDDTAEREGLIDVPDTRNVATAGSTDATAGPPPDPEDAAQTNPGAASGATHDADAPTEAAPGPILEPNQNATQEPQPEDIELPAATAAPPSPPRPAKGAPSFVRRRAAASGVATKRGWLTVAAIGVLTLALLLQLLLADRAQLAANARWRPAMSMLCGTLHCTLPPWREPDAFTLQQRDVRPHPSIAGTLRVTATFRNDARWPQPWPGLLLTLSDIDGRTLGARTFTVNEYLADNDRKVPAQTQKTLASGQSVTISMDVVEPTPRIVAFTFEFQ